MPVQKECFTHPLPPAAPEAGTQGRVTTDDVHGTFPQALSKSLIVSCSGTSDTIVCLVTHRSFFEIFFHSSLQSVDFIFFFFLFLVRIAGDLLGERVALLCMKKIMGKIRWK